LKLAVNIHCLHPPLTGIGHYARNLLLQLMQDSRIDELVGVSHSGWHSREELAAMLASSRGYAPGENGTVSEGLPLRLGRRIAGRLPGMGRLRAWVNHHIHLRERAAHKGFLYWEPNYLLLPIANPALATVHDLSHLRFPQFHPQARLAELRHLPDSLRRARRIATVSEYTRGELAKFFTLDPASIDLVPPAVSPRFRPHSESECAAVRAELNLPERYLLYTGTIEPRKNLPRLLQAYSDLPASMQDRYKLVLAGGDGWHEQQFTEALQGVDARNIVRLGYVHREQLPPLISGATILAYPSIYEGFGMPVLEAMASGTAVLTANAASMPEVSAGAARLVDPLSQEDMRRGLQELLEDESKRRTLCEKGLLVAAGYSWEKSGQSLVHALQQVAAA
jgi:alpha-1,3-rhamnosyl/mannosyltransferase